MLKHAEWHYRVPSEAAWAGVSATLPCHPGVSVTAHIHIAGRGRYILDGVLHDVSERDALLTRAGSTRALHQVGENDPILLVVYPKRRRAVSVCSARRARERLAEADIDHPAEAGCPATW